MYLKPVRNETTAKTIRKTAEIPYMVLDKRSLITGFL
jgi:hypothetical protein